MLNKRETIGYIVGRFQPLHIGHIELIENMIENVAHPILFIGSANKSREIKNPLTYNERKEIILKEFPDLTILPIDDVGNTKEWSNNLNKSILNIVKKKNINIENIYFFTSDKENDAILRYQWIKEFKHEISNISNIDMLSATTIREAIKNKNNQFLINNLSTKTVNHIMKLEHHFF